MLMSRNYNEESPLHVYIQRGFCSDILCNWGRWIK